MRLRARASTALQMEHQSAHTNIPALDHPSMRWASGSRTLPRTALTSLRRVLCLLLTMSRAFAAQPLNHVSHGLVSGSVPCANHVPHGLIFGSVPCARRCTQLDACTSTAWQPQMYHALSL